MSDELRRPVTGAAGVPDENKSIEGHTYYHQSGLSPGESMASYLKRGPICLVHGSRECVAEELAAMCEDFERDAWEHGKARKCVLVPEGMLKAAAKAETALGGLLSERDTELILEAAPLWQRDNPSVPTEDQLRDLRISYRSLPEEGAGIVWPIWICGEWIRRMYDAPKVLDHASPVTEYDLPFGKVVIDTRVPPGEIRLHDWTGPTVMRNVAAVGLEVAKDIESLMAKPDFPHSAEINRCILEAYRRGRDSTK